MTNPIGKGNAFYKIDSVFAFRSFFLIFLYLGKNWPKWLKHLGLMLLNLICLVHMEWEREEWV